MESNERKFLPAFAELIDRLTVNQIKEVLLPDISNSVAGEMETLCHDIDLLIKERELPLSSRFIRIVIALSQ